MSRPKLFDGVLLNSACPWATSDLKDLLDSKYTCAVTTQTSSQFGFEHDDVIHNHVFVDEDGHIVDRAKSEGKAISSLNTYGYSSKPFQHYWDFRRATASIYSKPWIFSIDYITMDRILDDHAEFLESPKDEPGKELFFEINLSCPNLQGKSPPGYDIEQIHDILKRLQMRLHYKASYGFKLPPYGTKKHFLDLVETLEKFDEAQPITFLTTTNTFGGCKYLKPDQTSQTCGLGGKAIHALSVQNVAMLYETLQASSCKSVRDIAIIGVGGVSDGAGVKRMLDAGASHVALATALGVHGVGVFEKISKKFEEIQQETDSRDANANFKGLYEKLSVEPGAMTVKG